MDTWYLSVHSAHLTGENAAELENPSWNGFGEGNRILEYAKDILVETLTTGQNGKDVLNDLPLGSYKIVETKAPEGFVLNEIPQIVTFAYADQETPVVKQTAVFENDRQRRRFPW